ncbi:hypothetical protein RRG08_028206 [Elysia crispata]|uniref:Uncharacterized protein n=1 Tax=Elysia crispata TaxID=231223 RepID=A0AAE1CVW6_9GAST|nr:hypothetical protein RRG08_028206 [Elysia crispata]
MLKADLGLLQEIPVTVRYALNACPEVAEKFRDLKQSCGITVGSQLTLHLVPAIPPFILPFLINHLLCGGACAVLPVLTCSNILAACETYSLVTSETTFKETETGAAPGDGWYFEVNAQNVKEPLGNSKVSRYPVRTLQCMAREEFYTCTNYILMVISGVIAGLLVLAVAFLALRESRLCCRLFSYLLLIYHGRRGRRKVIRVMPRSCDVVVPADG